MSGKGKTKAEIMKNQITSFCEEYGMHAEFKGGTVFITTFAGEWFFAFNDRPIRLHHKNYSEDAKKLDQRDNFYHLQERRFAAPLHVLKYICEHDIDLKRRMMQEVESEIATDKYFYSKSSEYVIAQPEESIKASNGFLDLLRRVFDRNK